MGISEDEAWILLDNDIKNITEEIYSAFPWSDDLPPRAKLVLMDLAFNMGVPTLSSFKNMLECLKVKDWEGASENLIDSKYALQVGRRAIYNAHLLETAGEESELPLNIKA
jgi:lysozyme